MIEPGRYEGVPVYTLLEAASHGYIAIDHRFLHAVLDNPENTVPDLVRFAARDLDSDRIVLDIDLVDIFHHLGTPEALPFFIDQVRRNLNDVPDDLVEVLAMLGSAAVD